MFEGRWTSHVVVPEADVFAKDHASKSQGPHDAPHVWPPDAEVHRRNDTFFEEDLKSG